MTYTQCFPPDHFNDGDVLDGCNLSGRELDFEGKAVTVCDSNCFDMTPLNSDNVIVIDSPSWGKASTPDESEPVDPIARETDTLLARLAEISVDNADMVSEKMAEKSDVIPLDVASQIMSARPEPVDVIKEKP